MNPEVFKGEDRIAMTPCMKGFEKWWQENCKNFAVGVGDAWRIYRAGWWTLEDQTNAYADRAIRRDILERHSGRPDQDLDVTGQPLKAGT